MSQGVSDHRRPSRSHADETFSLASSSSVTVVRVENTSNYDGSTGADRRAASSCVSFDIGAKGSRATAMIIPTSSDCIVLHVSLPNTGLSIPRVCKDVARFPSHIVLASEPLSVNFAADSVSLRWCVAAWHTKVLRIVVFMLQWDISIFPAVGTPLVVSAKSVIRSPWCPLPRSAHQVVAPAATLTRSSSLDSKTNHVLLVVRGGLIEPSAKNISIGAVLSTRKDKSIWTLCSLPIMAEASESFKQFRTQAAASDATCANGTPSSWLLSLELLNCTRGGANFVTFFHVRCDEGRNGETCVVAHQMELQGPHEMPAMTFVSLVSWNHVLQTILTSWTTSLEPLAPYGPIPPRRVLVNRLDGHNCSVASYRGQIMSSPDSPSETLCGRVLNVTDDQELCGIVCDSSSRSLLAFTCCLRDGPQQRARSRRHVLCTKRSRSSRPTLPALVCLDDDIRCLAGQMS